METLRLRQIQEPSRVERLLEAYISRNGSLPADAYRVRNPVELPGSLRSVLAGAIHKGEVWSCWARGSQMWLFICHMSLDLSRERGAPVILVRVYGEHAGLKDSGTWRYDSEGMWIRCND